MGSKLMCELIRGWSLYSIPEGTPYGDARQREPVPPFQVKRPKKMKAHTNIENKDAIHSLWSAIDEFCNAEGGRHDEEEEGRVQQDVLGEDKCARLTHHHHSSQ